MPEFTDDPNLTAQDKATLLADWRRFIRGGFQFDHLTEPLFRHLVALPPLAESEPTSRFDFWSYHFDNGLYDLLEFLNIFTRHLNPVPERWWGPGDPGADLSEALCHELALVEDILLETLEQIETETWQEIKWGEIEAWLPELAAEQPDWSEADLRSYLSERFEWGEFFDWYPDLELSAEIRRRLAQALAENLSRVKSASLFAAGDRRPKIKRRPTSPAGPVRAQQAHLSLFQRCTTDKTATQPASSLWERLSAHHTTTADDNLPDGETPEIPIDLESIKRRLQASPAELQRLASRPQAAQQTLRKEANRA